MNQTRPGKWVQDTALIFIFPTLLWLLAGCTGGQVINTVTPIATAVSATLPPQPPATPTNLPRPTTPPTATEPVAATPPPATATLEPTAEITSEAQDFYYNGLTYTAAGLPEEAMASFNQAIALQPDYALAYLERGKLYMQQKQLAQAKSDYHYALELTADPEIKAEVKILLQQLASLEAPAPSPTADQATPIPPATPILEQGPLQEVQLDQPFILPLGHTAWLKEAGLSLTFSSVLEDSRCPKQVNCFWAGQVRIMIQVQQEQGEASLLEMNTNPPLKQNIVTYAGYEIQLMNVDPYPETPDQNIPPEDYQTTFIVKAK